MNKMNFYYAVVAGQFEYIHATKKTKTNEIKADVLKELYPDRYKQMKPTKLVKLTKLKSLSASTASIHIYVESNYEVE